MSDHLSKAERSWNMSRIKASDTSVEKKVRHYLFALGYRYRKNDKRYPGKPDIVLPKYNTVVFVHGCFWHRHPNCKRATTPKSNTDYWVAKFKKNVENDLLHYEQLKSSGWKVIVLWECDINGRFEETMANLIKDIEE